MRIFSKLCAGALLLLFSCRSDSPPAPPKQVCKINIEEDPRTLDPRKGRSLLERNLCLMLFDGLTRFGPNGITELSLARDYTVSEDGLVYTFTLKDAVWSNGDPITADHFVYAWTTASSPSFPSETAYHLFCVRNGEAVKKGEQSPDALGIRALDPRTVSITLEKPVPYFLELLSLPIFFPLHPQIDAGESLYSGPFQLQARKYNDSIELVKNDRYFDADRTRLTSVSMVMVDPETEIKMFENQELHRAGSPLSILPREQMDSLRKNPTFESQSFLGTAFFRVNTEKSPLNNLHVRKALASAIHRSALIEHVIRGDQKPALQFLPGSSVAYLSDGDGDRARGYFRQGLAELGLAEKAFPKLSLLCSATQQNRLIAQAVQEDWRKHLGVECSVELTEPKVYYGKIGNGQYDLALGSWFADYNDPQSFLDVFKYKEDSCNNTGWENPGYVDALNESVLLPPGERTRRLSFCESILMGELPVIPLYHFSSHYLQNPALKGTVVSPLGSLDLKWAYLDDTN